MGNGDVLQSDIELLGPLEQVLADSVTDGLTLCDELGGIELRDNRLQNFVSDGRKDTLVVILTEILRSISITLQNIAEYLYLVNLGQLRDFWSMQDSQSQANHLHVLTSGRSRDVSGLRPDIVDNALLQPWDQEMCAFVGDCVLHSRDSVEDNCASATLHIVHRGLGDRCCDGDWDSPFVN